MISDTLATLGAFVGAEDFEKATFEWQADEQSAPVKFEITYKKEATVADFEYINMAGRGGENNSLMARTVHRLVRLVSVNGEKPEGNGQLPLASCESLKPSLLLAFFLAIGGGNGRGKPPAKAPAKKAPAKKVPARKV